MKQILVTIAFLFLILCFACKKHEIIETAELPKFNSAQLISNSNSKGRVCYGITTLVGHSASTCPGCVNTGEHCIHVDCQGTGTACSVSARMVISDSGEINFYYGTIDEPDELTFEETFLMPDRSLYIIGSNGQFLNIPEQTVYRDEETGAFVFCDIFFSDAQVFINE
jgi:hypothetical protein